MMPIQFKRDDLECGSQRSPASKCGTGGHGKRLVMCTMSPLMNCAVYPYRFRIVGSARVLLSPLLATVYPRMLIRSAPKAEASASKWAKILPGSTARAIEALVVVDPS